MGARVERERTGQEDEEPVDAGILAALGRFQEVGIYTNGADLWRAVDEIREALVHVTAYCGAPAGGRHSPRRTKPWSQREH